jgi:hypothetical protein
MNPIYRQEVLQFSDKTYRDWIWIIITNLNIKANRKRLA